MMVVTPCQVQMDMVGIYKVEGDCGQVKFLEFLSSIYIVKAPFTHILERLFSNQR